MERKEDFIYPFRKLMFSITQDFDVNAAMKMKRNILFVGIRIIAMFAGIWISV